MLIVFCCCRFNDIEIQINLANSRIHSTANGTTIFTRIIAIICLSIPVFMAMDILASDATEIDKSDDYSSPGPQLFITAFLFSTIPFYWIIFNVELRNYVIRKVSRQRNKIHPLLPKVKITPNVC